MTTAETKSTHGPDATLAQGRIDPPGLVKAREVLAGYLNSPPKSPCADILAPVAIPVDRDMAMAMLERNKINRKLSEHRIKEYTKLSTRKDAV